MVTCVLPLGPDRGASSGARQWPVASHTLSISLSQGQRQGVPTLPAGASSNTSPHPLLPHFLPPILPELARQALCQGWIQASCAGTHLAVALSPSCTHTVPSAQHVDAATQSCLGLCHQSLTTFWPQCKTLFKYSYVTFPFSV